MVSDRFQILFCTDSNTHHHLLHVHLDCCCLVSCKPIQVGYMYCMSINQSTYFFVIKCINGQANVILYVLVFNRLFKDPHFLGTI